MIKCVDITTITPKENEKFLLDANVLLYLFYTPGSYRKEMICDYKNFFIEIIKNNSKIILSSNLLGEFFNRFIKMNLDTYVLKNNLLPTTFQLKDFRKTDEFGDVIKELLTIFNLQLLPYAEFTTHQITGASVNLLLNSAYGMDFNDCFYCETANELSIPIITNDYDFVNNDDKKKIVIITGNEKILERTNVF